ncbi:MAG: hypothetical protein INR69_09115 [Mucilaginibacter polytrichastri]|nr:hypothetical protein [Mucilaginibacter polytrichastri]
MATPKKTTKGLSSDSENEKLNSKPSGSRYNEDDDDLDEVQFDDFDSYESNYDDDEYDDD